MTKSSQHIATALAEPKFALFAFGQIVSQFGDYLAQIALIALMGEITTRAPLAYSQLTVAISLPTLLFGPVIGVMVDRRSKRLVLMVADLGRALIIATIPVLMSPYHRGRSLVILFPLVFASFLLGQFASAARLSLIPQLVPPSKLFAANAVMNFTNKLAAVLGFVGGGFLVVGGFWQQFHLRPWQAAFFIDSLSFLASVATVALISLDEPAPLRRHGEKLGELWRGRTQDFREDLKELIRLPRTVPRLRFAIASLLLVAAFAGTLYPLVVVIVQRELYKPLNTLVSDAQSLVGSAPVQQTPGRAAANTRGIGVLGGILAMGMMAGSLFIGFLGHRVPRHWIIIAGLAGVGLSLAAFSRCHAYWELLLITVAAGVCLACVMIAQDTMLHESTPKNLWGRIFSGRDLLLNGGFMLCSLMFGFVAQILVPLTGSQHHERVTLLWAGILLALLGMAAGLLWPGRERNRGARP